jgi:hypothetical protein
VIYGLLGLEINFDDKRGQTRDLRRQTVTFELDNADAGQGQRLGCIHFCHEWIAF